MQNNQYNINDKKATNNARIATVATALLVLLGLFFISFTIADNDEEQEEGILVNFGTLDVGSGDIQPEQIADEYAEVEQEEEQVKKVAQPKSEPTPTKQTKEEPIVQKEETVKITPKKDTKPQPKPSQETKETNQTDKTQEAEKTQEAAKPSVNKRALYPGSKNNNSTGEGQTGDPGDQGSTSGVPDKGAYEGTSYGQGKDGVQYSLRGRKMIGPPSLSDNSNAVGKITVKIKVDQNGNVIDASLGTPTTISSSSLINKSIAAAKRAKFDQNKQATEEQFGTITFVFKVQ